MSDSRPASGASWTPTGEFVTNPYRVLSDGNEVGRFDTHEEAQDMANGWNHAYPASEGYGTDFVVDRPCADVDCGYCG